MMRIAWLRINSSATAAALSHPRSQMTLGGAPPFNCHEVVIRIRRNDCEAVVPGEFPDQMVRRLENVELDYMSRASENIGNSRRKPPGEVLVKEERQRATRRPILTAKSKTARKSAGSSSG